MAAPWTSEPKDKTTPPIGRIAMDRVRTGVTGLAFILLIVALATAIASGVRQTANASETAAPSIANVSNNKSEKSDPLGQLGVTPPVEQAGPANGATVR